MIINVSPFIRNYLDGISKKCPNLTTPHVIQFQVTMDWTWPASYKGHKFWNKNVENHQKDFIDWKAEIDATGTSSYSTAMFTPSFNMVSFS